jgi:hypothetical protein
MTKQQAIKNKKRPIFSAPRQGKREILERS